jgi:hypothetical protein
MLLQLSFYTVHLFFAAYFSSVKILDKIRSQALPLLQKYIIGAPNSRQYSLQTAQVLQIHCWLGSRSLQVASPVEQ